MVLDDICVLIADCPHSTAPDEGSGYPLIRTPNIGKARFLLDGVHRVSKQVYEQRNKRATPQDNDIIFAREAPAGNAAIIKNGDKYCLGQRTVLIRPDPQKVNPDYLVYYLLAPEQQHKLLSTAHGATVSHVNIPDIHNMNVDNLPSIENQKQIANTLNAYDDLIENNQKQIKLLEEAAQRLYKEWFIDLRFSGHESTPIHDGIPEGWERKSVEECLQMHINGGWGKESPEAKNCIPGRVIRGTDINDVKAGNLNDIPLRYHTENDVSKRALRQGDIIFELSNGNLANIGRTLFVDDLLLQYCGNPTICASFCKLFRPVDRLHALMLYWEIQDMQASGRMLPYKKHGANGINNFDFEGFLKHKLLVPMSLEYVAPFDLVMQKESVIQHELMLLTEARDRLLPKLMSGEIEV